MTFYPDKPHMIHLPQKDGQVAVAYQMSGRYRHHYNGEIVYMEKDSVMIYNASDSYEVFEEECGTCIAAHFRTAALSELHFTILDGNKIPQIKADFQRMLKAYNRRDEYSWYESLSELYAILGKIQRAANSDEQYVQRMRYANIIRARDYLAEHFNDPTLSLEDGATVAGVSPRRFGEIFRRLYGMTPGRYITHLRISAAEDMLRMKNYTVAEIAASVGYANPSYFCRVFKNETGISPRRWMEYEGDI